VIKTKTIYLSGAGGMGNIGAEAILLAIIHLFQERYENPRFVLAAWRPERVRQLLAGVPGNFTVVHQSIPFDHPRQLRQSDLFLICGDVALTESVIWFLPCYWAFKSLWARLFGARVVFLGIEVEHIRHWINRLAIRLILNPVVDHYVLRNDESLEHLQRLSAAPASLQLACEPALTIADKHLAAFPAPDLKANGAEMLVGFAVRDYFADPLKLDLLRMKLRRRDVVPGQLSVSMEQTVAFLARLADHLVEKHRARIVFIPHHFLAAGEKVILTDHEVAERVRAAMKHASQTILMPDDLHPFAVMNLYRRLDLVVSMRHHANAFAHRFGVPTVGLAISGKIIGYFRQVKLERLLVNPLDPDMTKALQTVEHAIRDRAEISAHLRDCLARLQETMKPAIAAIAEG
jgi:polysaccharide pyruvyl transferase WcaK-like protein